MVRRARRAPASRRCLTTRSMTAGSETRATWGRGTDAGEVASSPYHSAWPSAWPGGCHLPASVRISLQLDGPSAARLANLRNLKNHCENVHPAAKECSEHRRGVECPIGLEPTTLPSAWEADALEC